MKRNKSLCIAAITFVMIFIACGSEAAPSLVGNWNAEIAGEVKGIEFREDGVVMPEGEEQQRYEIVEGEPDLVVVTSMDSDDISIELELVFEDKDHCSLSADGMTAVLTRVE
jgi:hypothetical protein